MKFTLGIIALFSLLSCTPKAGKYANEVAASLKESGQNKVELTKALKSYTGDKKEAMEFLIAFMPKRDLKTLSADLLTANVDYAFKARQAFPWCAKLDKEVFYNEVLPYVSINERRDNWRADFFKRFSKYVAGKKNITDAIWAVNKSINKEVKVEYNTKREKADQSPYESMKSGMASCTGLSILLVDAFRSVGIPARLADTPLWHDKSGNHSWVEVCVNGTWHFTEYYPSGEFDNSWFLDRAGKADVADKEQWIYASSYKPTTLSFPLVWDRSITYVHASNVTQRYIDLYNKKQAKKNAHTKINVQLIMLKRKVCTVAGNNRVKTQVTLLKDNKQVTKGFTSGTIDDMNRYLHFELNSNEDYQISYINKKGKTVIKDINATKDTELILYYNED